MGSFDILQGLVIAVDTKDRYTKRHSEDVARYAVLLARRLGLDEDLQRTIHLAGLLHDIGKIGIPDAVLRKPSKLTADEYAMFQQHVALGDAIVRDVPNVDLSAAASGTTTSAGWKGIPRQPRGRGDPDHRPDPRR